MCHDDASRFLRIVTRGTKRSHIIPEDLIPLVQDVVNTHPGLAFLKQAPEFHSRYVHTVSTYPRLYYRIYCGKKALGTLCANQGHNFLIGIRARTKVGQYKDCVTERSQNSLSALVAKNNIVRKYRLYI